MGTTNTEDPDIVVVGSGPNGLVAAGTLARLGYRVLVLEAHEKRLGGALGSEELTLPGYIHDVGAAFFPFHNSDAFRHLEVERHGVTWMHAEVESAHPALDGSISCIVREPEKRPFEFGSPDDVKVWQGMSVSYARLEADFLDAIMGPLPNSAMLKVFPWEWWSLGKMAMSSGRAFTSVFRTEAARRVLPSLAAHADVAPDDRFSAAVGYVLGMAATRAGFPVPKGGARSVAEALLADLTEHGGEVRMNSRVDRILTRQGAAVGVHLADGTEVRARHAVMANVSAPALFLDLVDKKLIPDGVLHRMERFPQGPGTFKMDWALSGPVPWAHPSAGQSAVVHLCESLDDLQRYSTDIRAGRLPEKPYMVVGQQSVVDRKRAPSGKHTLWAYTHVPSSAEGGWKEHKERFADRLEERVEGLAPGFRKLILGRHIQSPPDLESWNANLRGGDIGGGSNRMNNLLVFRPAFPHFRYRTPVAGLYLCSSYAHPGAGVHGMCGYNAALLAAQDLG